MKPIRLFVTRGLTGPLAVLLLWACQPSAERLAAQGSQAQQLLDAGRPREALTLINAAVAERDDIPSLLMVQGRVAAALGDRNLAYRAYANALALEASNAEALVAVSQLGLQTGHLNEAGAAADTLLVLQPEHPAALTTKTLIAIARSDLDTAGGLADRVLRSQPGDLGGLVLKSRVQALRGDRTAALATLRTGEAQHASEPIYLLALIELLRAGGDPTQLLEQLRRLTTLAPDQLGYRLDLIDVLYRQGQREAARTAVADLIAKPVADPAIIEGIVRLWNAHDREAMTPATLAAAAGAASPEARLALARFLLATDRADAAVTMLAPVTGTSGDADGVQVLARVTRPGGDRGAIAAVTEQLLARDPGNGGALLARARQAMAEARPRDAVADAQRVVADYPSWDEGFLALATAYSALRDRVGVRRAFEDGLKARPQSLPLFTRYVETLIGLGDGSRAVEVARRFALDSPSLGAAWSLYTATCARTRADGCREEAAEGSARSRNRYGLDPAPGTPQPIAAVGRLP